MQFQTKTTVFGHTSIEIKAIERTWEGIGTRQKLLTAVIFLDVLMILDVASG